MIYTAHTWLPHWPTCRVMISCGILTQSRLEEIHMIRLVFGRVCCVDWGCCMPRGWRAFFSNGGWRESFAWWLPRLGNPTSGYSGKSKLLYEVVLLLTPNNTGPRLMSALQGFKETMGERVHTFHRQHPLVLLRKGPWFRYDLFHGLTCHFYGICNSESKLKATPMTVHKT